MLLNSPIHNCTNLCIVQRPPLVGIPPSISSSYDKNTIQTLSMGADFLSTLSPSHRVTGNRAARKTASPAPCCSMRGRDRRVPRTVSLQSCWDPYQRGSKNGYNIHLLSFLTFSLFWPFSIVISKWFLMHA